MTDLLVSHRGLNEALWNGSKVQAIAKDRKKTQRQKRKEEVSKDNEAKSLRKRQRTEEIQEYKGMETKWERREEARREDKSVLVKIQGRLWREAIITIHQDNK